MDLSRRFTVTVNRASPRISKVGFGTAGIYARVLTTIIPATERTREYLTATGLADMVTDGFATDHPAYIAATALCAQSPRPKRFKVLCGRLDYDHHVDLLAKTFATGETITLSMTLHGVTYDFTRACGGGSLAAEATALKALIDATALVVGGHITCTVAGNDLQIRAVTPAHANETIYYSGLHNLNVSDVTADRGIAADMAAIIAADPDWYCLVPADAFGAAELALLATWTETQEKIMSFGTQDTTVEAGTGIFNTLHAATRDRSIGCYSQHAMSENPGAAMAGRFLAEEPGEANWADKSLSGVTPSELTSAQIALIEADSGNTYTTTAGVGNLFPGSVTSGEFVDIIILADYVVARVREGCFSLARASRKIPFTNDGVAQLRGVCLGVLQSKVPAGFVENSLVFSAPDVADVDPADKAARIMPDISFGADFTGAILYAAFTADLAF